MLKVSHSFAIFYGLEVLRCFDVSVGYDVLMFLRFLMCSRLLRCLGGSVF